MKNFLNITNDFLISTNIITKEFFFGTIIFLTWRTLINIKNPINALLKLMLIFIITAAVLISMNLSYLALIFLIIYLGAISILFLFIIMLFNSKSRENNNKKNKNVLIKNKTKISLTLLIITNNMLLSLFIINWLNTKTTQTFIEKINNGQTIITKEINDLVILKENMYLYNTMYIWIVVVLLLNCLYTINIIILTKNK